MSKGTLEFDLNDIDEKQAFFRAAKALDLALTLLNISNRLRETDKYDKAPITREEFFEILGDNNINLDEILS